MRPLLLGYLEQEKKAVPKDRQETAMYAVLFRHVLALEKQLQAMILASPSCDP